jgi:hypothetical protein
MSNLPEDPKPTDTAVPSGTDTAVSEQEAPTRSPATPAEALADRWRGKRT